MSAVSARRADNKYDARVGPKYCTIATVGANETRLAPSTCKKQMPKIDSNTRFVFAVVLGALLVLTAAACIWWVSDVVIVVVLSALAITVLLIIVSAVASGKVVAAVTLLAAVRNDSSNLVVDTNTGSSSSSSPTACWCTTSTTTFSTVSWNAVDSSSTSFVLIGVIDCGVVGDLALVGVVVGVVTTLDASVMLGVVLSLFALSLLMLSLLLLPITFVSSRVPLLSPLSLPPRITDNN